MNSLKISLNAKLARLSSTVTKSSRRLTDAYIKRHVVLSRRAGKPWTPKIRDYSSSLMTTYNVFENSVGLF